jgi:hypothetical protein
MVMPARHMWSGLAAAVFITVTATPVRTVAQAPTPSPLAAFGVNEAAARARILQTANEGASFVSAFEAVLERGYDKIAADRRVPATVAAFAWLKTFVSSPAFTASYAKSRDEHKPAGGPTTSVDEEVRQTIAHDVAELEKGKEGLSVLPPATRAAATAEIDKTIANMRSPEYAANLRRMQEAGRTDQASAQVADTAKWEKKWPADPRVYVRTHLETYLADTAAVDFASPTIFVKDDTGATVGILRAGMMSIAFESAHAILLGKPATDAARSFADAWVKELR